MVEQAGVVPAVTTEAPPLEDQALEGTGMPEGLAPPPSSPAED